MNIYSLQSVSLAFHVQYANDVDLVLHNPDQDIKRLLVAIKTGLKTTTLSWININRKLQKILLEKVSFN